MPIILKIIVSCEKFMERIAMLGGGGEVGLHLPPLQLKARFLSLLTHD